MATIQSNIDQTLSSFEHGLNIAGYLPIVSTFSGSLRISYGKTEVVSAIAVAALLAVKALFNPDDAGRNNELNRAVEVLCTYGSHGLANIVRGLIEIWPFISLATCLPYDLFVHRFSYPTEQKELPITIGSPLFRSTQI